MISRTKTLVLAVFFSFSLLSAQEAQQKSIAVTVYNSNLGVIKDTRTINVKKGISEIAIKDVAQMIDPTSVHMKLDGDVLEQNYQYDLVNAQKILGKYVDNTVQLINEKGEVIEGKLLSGQGDIVLQKKDGGLIMIPNLTNYRISVGSLPEGLITRPTLLWTVSAKSAKDQDVEISYQTGGMSWHAEYVAVLNENDSQLGLNSWVSIENNSGTAYKNATLKLVAGDINQVKTREPRNLGIQSDYMMKTEAAPQFQEKEFFEYHIYNLQRPATLMNNETKQISLFQADNVKAQKKFLYKSGSSYYYSTDSEGNKKVSVVVEFDNKENNNLGMPMPKGKVRVYKSDGKSIEFIGEDMIDHTPREERIKLRIGDAFDVLAEEVQTDNKRLSDKVYEQAYQIKLKNRKKEDITVDVERYLGLNWEIMKSSLDFEKKDAQNIIYHVPVAKNSETTLTFRVRYSY
ncbi:MAG: DUF4139 domain-containing protein [Syntrophothermus sp.]